MIAYFFLITTLSLSCMQSQPIPQTDSARRSLLDHVITYTQTEDVPAPSIVLKKCAEECTQALDSVFNDDQSNEKFATALKLFSKEAKSTSQFFRQWQAYWQCQLLAKAAVKVEVAKAVMNAHAQRNSMNHSNQSQLEANLEHALQNQIRLQEFDQYCKTNFPLFS